MAAAGSGCHYGDINNGIVITTSCEMDTGTSRMYCHYYCDGGYLKTSSKVYCAGNETWLPSHPEESVPCVRDDRPKTTRNPSMSSPRPTPSPLPPHWPVPSRQTPPVWTQPATTTRKGYYKDPHLEMNVSPAIFVGAVVGGIIAVVLVVFAIFFRAHKKARQEHMERMVHCFDANTPTCPVQPEIQEDDSIFRAIAQRVIANANNDQNGGQGRPEAEFSPPPYEEISTARNDQACRSEIQIDTSERSPTYSAAIPFSSNFPTNTTSSHDHPRDSGNGGSSLVGISDVVIGDVDSPPPYEESIKMHNQERGGNLFNDGKINGSNLPPPPPYSDA
ncbi:hypothetical protein ACF0H5_000286 [Mactra antiquata]